MTASQCQRIIDKYGPYPSKVPEQVWSVYLGKKMGPHFNTYFNSEHAPSTIKDGNRMARLGLQFACATLARRRAMANRPS